MKLKAGAICSNQFKLSCRWYSFWRAGKLGRAWMDIEYRRRRQAF